MIWSHNLLKQISLRSKQSFGVLIFTIYLPFLKLVLSPNRSYVLLVDFKAKEVLLVKNLISPPLSWAAPGGGKKRGETIVDNACREVFEEINLKLQPSKLKLVYTKKVFSRFSYGQLSYFVYPIKKQALNYNRKEILTFSWKPLHTCKYLKSPLNKVLPRIVKLNLS